MANGYLMWIIGTLICVGAFLNGVRFARMESAGPLPRDAHAFRRLGKLLIVTTPLFWIFWTLLLLGYLGPVDGIRTITLN